MVMCLVTDRRRLGAAIGAGPAGLLDALEAQVLAAAEAGIDLVQIREGDLDARPLTAFVRSLAARLRGWHTRLLVNDRLDVALAAGADGVHLRETSIAPALASTFAKASAFAKATADRTADKPADGRLVISCAVHTPVTAAARRSADFLIAGAVLPTVSKPHADYLGWKGLEEVIGAARGTPVLGIGGLDLSAIPPLAATGAAGLAAIGAFIPPAGDSGLSEFVKKRVIDMRFAFDSARPEP
jgi:thiamine-phosphate pyrophosphorylase